MILGGTPTFWPSAQDYIEAVQCPEISFEDTDLQSGEVELTPLGLPKVASGNFACVYKFDCGNKSYAVKCFLRNVFDRHRRYNMLSQFTTTTHVDHMVDFEYQLKGICIEGNWYPIVKMEWVDGLTFDQFVRKNWSNKAQLYRVITQFTQLMQELKALGVAHSDLQHGNLLVKDNGIKLVDYDNMFVPSMAGETSGELGHANYQHLYRSERDFGPHLDNFSAWIIYYSLYCLRLDHSLWQRHGGGDDCLLFRRSDFTAPTKSRLLNEIKNHPVPDIQAQWEPLMRLLHYSLDQVPNFEFHSASSSAQVRTPENGNTESETLPSETQPNVLQQGQPSVEPAPRYVYPKRWPSIEQYFWAAVKPAKFMSDEKLAKGVPVPTDGRTSQYVEADATTRETVQLTKFVIKGRNHIIFHFVGELDAENNRRHYAIKCFLHNVPDRYERYTAIHKHKKTVSNKYFVPFVYQPHGIKIGDDWYPIVKMLWVQGLTLEDYVSKQLNLGAPTVIEELQHKFVKMIDALAVDGIAHGDIEPRNILVDDYGELKIVDYDGMYVPALAHLQGCELGLKSYQHPSRSLNNFGNYIDNFSTLLVYGLLVLMAKTPPQNLWTWELLLQHVRSQPSTLTQESRRKTSDRLLIQSKNKPTQIVTDDPEILFNPKFEKASPSVEGQRVTFDAAVDKLTRVLREQYKRRIDQVSRLDVSLWNIS